MILLRGLRGAVKNRGTGGPTAKCFVLFQSHFSNESLAFLTWEEYIHFQTPVKVPSQIFRLHKRGTLRTSLQPLRTAFWGGFFNGLLLKNLGIVRNNGLFL